MIWIDNLDKENFVFVSNRGDEYSIKSLQSIVKKAGLENYKEVHCHKLRHSFATHLLENDYSLTDVQTSLGHKSPETSLNYTHTDGRMIQIFSLLDNL